MRKLVDFFTAVIDILDWPKKAERALAVAARNEEEAKSIYGI